jgi:hypothetical protein
MVPITNKFTINSEFFDELVKDAEALKNHNNNQFRGIMTAKQRMRTVDAYHTS